MGEMYWIHPIHAGILPVFLKKPENKVNGMMTIGMAEATDFSSVITLPNNSPKEFPQRPTKKAIK